MARNGLSWVLAAVFTAGLTAINVYLAMHSTGAVSWINWVVAGVLAVVTVAELVLAVLSR